MGSDLLEQLKLENFDAQIRKWLQPLLHTMPEDILKHCRLCRLRPGGAVMMAGDDVNAVFLLLSGKVNIMNEWEDGTVYSLGHVYAPTVLGEFEALTGVACYRGTVRCETACRLLFFPKEIFMRWMQTDNQALFRITVSIIKKANSQSSHDRMFLFSSGRNRLIHYLERYYEENAVNGVSKVYEPRYQMADAVGLSVKTVNRCIGALKEEALIGQDGKKIIITQKQYETLREIEKAHMH